MRLHGVRLPHKKGTANMKPVHIPLPDKVTIPMLMHIGKPARVIVKKGDKVKVGQLIGESDGMLSSDIHASVSGTVTKIDEMITASGKRVQCVTIESDGKQEMVEGLKPPEVNDYESFVSAVKRSGIVGMGGAGFPSFVKLSVDDLSKIDAVVINAAECEPYITSDTRTVIDRKKYVFKGIEYIKKYMGVNRFIIGIEKNNREAIAVLRRMADRTKNVEVKVLPSIYPQGGEKVLVYNTMKRVVPKRGHPFDVGVVVINVTTLACIAKYLENGVPLFEKCLTIDGSAVKSPKNVIAPIGTSIGRMIQSSGGFRCDPAKVLYGGPMMGIAVPSLDAPVLKNTNAVICMDKYEAAPPKVTPCISCGACLNHCPFRLDPREIALAYKRKDTDALEYLHVDLCMECGCCSYICPANRPLVQTNKLSKIMLAQAQQQKKEDKNE